jgi:hypothetical protein
VLAERLDGFQLLCWVLHDQRVQVVPPQAWPSSQALTVILPLQIACYLAAAALMLLLPSRAASATPSSTPVLDEGK